MAAPVVIRPARKLRRFRYSDFGVSSELLGSVADFTLQSILSPGSAIRLASENSKPAGTSPYIFREAVASVAASAGRAPLRSANRPAWRPTHFYPAQQSRLGKQVPAC